MAVFRSGGARQLNKRNDQLTPKMHAQYRVRPALALAEAVKSGQLKVVAARYDIASGQVEIFP